MQIEAFELERIQSLWENRVAWNLSESGVHPLTVSELAGGDKEFIDRLMNRELGYSQTNGTVALRERIAALYPGAGPDDVTVTNGTSEANFITVWCLIDAGDDMVVMLPNYMQIRGLGRGFHGNVKTFYLRAENNWAPDLNQLRSAVGPRTRAIAVCNPNNPTGAVLSREEMTEIVEIASSAGAWLIADEVYLGAERIGPRTESFWSFRKNYDRIIINNGLSKAYGLPGLRIGWTISSSRLSTLLWSYRDYTTIAPSTLSDQIAQLALEPQTREKIFDRTRNILQHNYAIFSEWLKEHQDILSVIEPRAGAIAMMHYRIRESSVDLVEKLRREKDVLIIPGAYFGLEGYLRIGYGCKPEYLKEALKRLGEFLSQY